MTRIKEAAVEQYGPIFGEDADEFLRIISNRPALAEMLANVHHTLHGDRILPDRLLELVRLRVAFWNQCRSCMATRFPEAVADGLTEQLVCSLEKPQEADDLTPAERAAIAYADLMATDHLAITDETFEGLSEHFSEAEITELAINVAYFVGIGRFAATLHMVEGLPERFRSTQKRVTPWDDELATSVAASTTRIEE